MHAQNLWRLHGELVWPNCVGMLGWFKCVGMLG